MSLKDASDLWWKNPFICYVSQVSSRTSAAKGKDAAQRPDTSWSAAVVDAGVDVLQGRRVRGRAWVAGRGNARLRS
jgi:hypothetical protein